MNIEGLKPEQRWYVQLAPRSTLVEREIVEITKLTVLLKDPHTYSINNTSRWRFDEITFVEAC